MLNRIPVAPPARHSLRHLKPMAALLVLALLAAACGPVNSSRRRGGAPVEETQKQAEKEPQFKWEEQVVKLKVDAARPLLGQTVDASWAGTGIIVAPGIMVTNAHVALHAKAIDATTDAGDKVEVTRVLAIDQKSDLAVLAVESPEANDLALLDRPAEPRSLRSEKIVAIGNTADLGLSVYEGMVNNVTDAGYGEVIFHNANISSGSSGGPLFDETTQQLVGVNHAINHGYRFSIAIPAWTVDQLVAKAKQSPGRPLSQAFTVDETTKLKDTKTGQVCVDARTAERFVFPSKEGLDVGIRVETQGKPFAYNLHYAHEGRRLVRLGTSPVIQDSSSLGFTTPKSGYYVIEIGNLAEQGSGEACANVTLGAVDWEATLASN